MINYLQPKIAIISKLKIIVISIFLAVPLSCATYKQQSNIKQISSTNSKEVTYTFYIGGGYGNISKASNKNLLDTLKNEISSAEANSALLFTGDNISPLIDNWGQDQQLLENQLDLISDYEGKTIFLPGNNEWKSYDLNKMEKVEDYLKDKKVDNVAVFPENGCPIEHQVINEDLDLILIDSKWFVSNWSRLVDINRKCTDIVTRRRFMEELEGYINDGQGKNIVIAMHHPVFSNGAYAGNETFKRHMNPLPVYGTVKNTVMDLGAFNPEHLNSRRYNYLRIAVSALAQANDRITLLSGHEESLQLLSGGGIHQIISGSLSSKSATKLGKNRITAIGGSLEYEGNFAQGERGFSKLVYYKDGSSDVTFIREQGENKSFEVLPKLEPTDKKVDFDEINDKTVTTQVLDFQEDMYKSGFYKYLWGERYRNYFTKPVTAPVVKLDTLYGGLKVVKEGGGHQSFSLRLEDEKGKQYAMRSLKKSALKFLKFKLPGIAYTNDDFMDTWAEEVISDFFTTAHPFIQLVIDPLARSADINHSDTELFYVPKQELLGDYNDNFGDELYFIERRPSEEQLNYKGYRRTMDSHTGVVTDYESTTDMLEKIKSDESYTIDEKNFIRARIFDMLIGDWDRHQDQWRWIEYEGKDGDKEFMPIPRDRDNAFAKFDGAALKLIKLFVPNARRWQNFDDDINNVKWQNMGGHKMDRALLTRYDGDVWENEAKIIQENITTAVIDAAFKRLPVSVQDETAEKIKSNLMARLQQLPEKARDYGNYLSKVVAITGTEKDDVFEVLRMPNGNTKVIVKRLLSDEKNEKIYERTFNDKITKEIWLYGLGDDDEYMVSGKESSRTRIKIVGGYGNDRYSIENTSKLKVFEWEHENSVFVKEEPNTQMSDIYKTNTYHWRYFKPNTNTIAPTIGFRTDDGVFLGASNTFIKNGLNGNPFLQKHQVKANYYFGFEALELQYSGIWGNIIPKWNFELNGYYTSDSYAKNFFGLGNESVNNEDNVGRDFYRARLKQFRASAGIAYYTLRLRGLFESFRVNENDQRLFNTNNLRSELFENQNFGGVELSGYYDNADAKDFPSKSIYIGLRAGYKSNLELANNSFGYASLKVGFNHKVTSSGALVFGTTAEYKSLFNEKDVFFYHQPSLGGANGLRGFRDERFTGKSYFYQSSDIKLRLKRYITAVSPVTIGLYGGFDFGRTWEPGEESNIWHTSQGVGLWVSSLKALTFNIGYFNSRESNLVQVGFNLAI